MDYSPSYDLEQQFLKMAKAGTRALVSVSEFFDAKTSQIKTTPITHYPPTGKMSA
jgi:hypothetical protein